MRFQKLIVLMTNCVLFVLVGCSTKTLSKSSDLPSIVRERGSGSVGNMLSKELRLFGCQFSLDETSLAGTQSRWIIDRDTDGATVWIEGDHAASLLREFKKRFGEPAFIRPPGSMGYRIFVYRKDQCGVMVDCNLELQHGLEGLNTPVTAVGIHTKVLGLF
jgi:hypothetical protein